MGLRKRMETKALQLPKSVTIKMPPFDPFGKTGAEQLTAVTGATPPPPKTQAPKRVGVFYQVDPKQRAALVKVASKQLERLGGGKLDASRVLRDVLDDWIARGCPEKGGRNGSA